MNVSHTVGLSLLGLMAGLPIALARSTPVTTVDVNTDATVPDISSAQAAPSQPPEMMATTVAPTEISSDALTLFFSPQQIGQVNNYQAMAINLYNNAADGKIAVERLYLEGLELADTLTVDLTSQGPMSDASLAEFRAAELGIWGLKTSCIAECLEPAFELDVETFAAIAAQTTTTADDDFFQMVKAYYPNNPRIIDGELWDWPIFFRLTWDYGGYSLLGEGKHLALLRQIDQYRQHHAAYTLNSRWVVFDQQLQRMRHELLQDMVAETANCFGSEPRAIAAELTQILDQVELNPTEQATLRKKLETIQAGDSALGTDCATQPCNCTGG